MPNQTLGSISRTEKTILVGDYPHVVRDYPLKSGVLTEDHDGGLIMAQGPDGTLYPYNTTHDIDLGTGDGASKTFAGLLGGLVPGTVSISDGSETFTDDGFGILTGDGGGSGKVDYDAGRVSISFTTAPANEASITATVKNRMRGVLAGMTYSGADVAAICVLGPVNHNYLLVGSSAPTEAQLHELDNLGCWPNG